MYKSKKQNYMRTFFFTLLASLSIISCQKEKTTTLSKLPKNSIIVAKLSPYNLTSKGNVLNHLDSKVYKRFIREAKTQNRSLAKFVNDFLETPTISGIDWEEDLFIFYTDEGRKDKYTGLLFNISDSKKFDDFVEDFLDKSKIESDREEGKNFTYHISFNTKYTEYPVIGFTENIAIVLFPSFYTSDPKEKDHHLEDYLEELMEQKETRTIYTQNPNFMEFANQEKDLSIWIGLDNINDENFRNEIEFDLEDCALTFNLSLEKGKVVLESEFHPSEDIWEFQKRNNIFDLKQGIGSDIISKIPSSSFAIFSANLNIQNLLVYFEEMKDWDNFNKYFEQEAKVSIENLIEDIDGEFCIYLKSNSTKKEIPSITLAARLNNERNIKRLLHELPERNKIKQDDYYILGPQYSDDKVFLSIKDNMLLISNESREINDISNKRKNSFAQASISPVYGFLNFNSVFDLMPEIKEELERENIRDLDRIIDHFRVEVKDINTLLMTLELDKKDENSLKVIIDALLDAYKDID